MSRAEQWARNALNSYWNARRDFFNAYGFERGIEEWRWSPQRRALVLNAWRARRLRK